MHYYASGERSLIAPQVTHAGSRHSTIEPQIMYELRLYASTATIRIV